MKCDDPYWKGCTKPASFKRIKTDSLKKDEPKYLCEECFMLMEDNDNFITEEWVKMIY